jgi:hypothetical protein
VSGAKPTLDQAIEAMTREAVRRATPEDIAAMKAAILPNADALWEKMRERRGEALFRADPAAWYIQICREVARSRPVALTEQRVIEMIVDEARATVERIAKVDQRPWPEAAMADMLARVRKIARREAPKLLGCTEPQIREACSRHIRRQVADLRPS